MLRGAIIGLGGMGQNHLACYKSVDNVNIVAVCDTKPGHASTTVNNWGIDIPAYDDMETLIEKEKPDFVDIVTPTCSHAELTIKALEMGCHVICEKPMALNAADCQRMIDTAEKFNKTLMIAHVVRFMAPYFYLKNAIDTKKHGKLIKFTAKRVRSIPPQWIDDPQSHGGAVIDLPIHDIDYVQWVLGLPLGHYSHHYLRDDRTEFISTNMKYKGCSVFLEGGWFNSAVTFNSGFTAIFKKGVISCNNETAVENGRIIEFTPDMPELSMGIPCNSTDGYVRELTYFANCIENGKKPELSLPQSSLETIKLGKKLIAEAEKI